MQNRAISSLSSGIPSIFAYIEATPFLRGQLGKRMKMRAVPELRFYYDDSMDIGLRVDALLKGREDTYKSEDED